MPSPVGHALAGLATAWALEKPGSRTSPALLSPLPLVCGVLAAVPDVDLLYPPIHRTVTHGIGAALIVIIIAVAVTRWVTGRVAWRVALICGAAYATHILLDWLGRDPSAPVGIQAMWPFTHNWYIAPWTIFPGTERRHLFSAATVTKNAKSVVVELAILGPIAVAIAWWRSRRSI
jgi:inner membrane protein